MKILIADDEPLARKRLVGFVSDLANNDVVTEAADGTQAFTAIERDSPDVVLLDIRMPGLNGIELAMKINALPSPPVVIFTTAYDSHALQAYEVQAIDYLLKPVRRERFALALARAKRLVFMEQSTAKPGTAQHIVPRTEITVSWQGMLQVVPVAKIRYFRAEHKYVIVRYPQGMVLIEESLATLADEFNDRFLRAHRSTLVALSYIRRIERATDGRHYIHLDGIEDRIKISRRLNKAVRNALKGSHSITISSLS